MTPVIWKHALWLLWDWGGGAVEPKEAQFFFENALNTQSHHDLISILQKSPFSLKVFWKDSAVCQSTVFTVCQFFFFFYDVALALNVLSKTNFLT